MLNLIPFVVELATVQPPTAPKSLFERTKGVPSTTFPASGEVIDRLRTTHQALIRRSCDCPVGLMRLAMRSLLAF
jgi:hypothetical protein